jgi:hypothetical protein
MKEKFFAIRRGDSTGIFWETYEETRKRNPKEFKSFKNIEEAKEYMNPEPIETSDAQALIFADGSLNFNHNQIKYMDAEKVYASYGIVIFFKENKEVYYESGKLLDDPKQKGQKEKSVSVWRYGMNGERVDRACNPISGDALPEKISYKDIYQDDPRERPEINRWRHGFVQAGGSNTAELEGLSRALDICLGVRKLNRVVVVFDSSSIENNYKGSYNKKRNGTNYYGIKFEDYKDKDVKFIKVSSHNKNEGDLYYTFNDCVDILAKAETESGPIGAAENPNVKDYLADKNISKDDTIEQRRKKARLLVGEVIENEVIRKNIVLPG